MEPWEEKLRARKILAVITIEELEDAVPLARALVEGGITGMELTMRTPVALDALKLISAEVPEMFAGVGTVLTVDQVFQVKNAGADFAVSPGMNPKVVKAAQQEELPFSPGVMTPTDIEMALECDCTLLKYFPAESAGGLAHLESMATPYKHLGVEFIPLGGLKTSNAKEYLTHPLIPAIGGSWIAPQKLIKEKNWAKIKENAQETQRMIRSLA